MRTDNVMADIYDMIPYPVPLHFKLTSEDRRRALAEFIADYYEEAVCQNGALFYITSPFTGYTVIDSNGTVIVDGRCDTEDMEQLIEEIVLAGFEIND